MRLLFLDQFKFLSHTTVLRGKLQSTTSATTTAPEKNSPLIPGGNTPTNKTNKHEQEETSPFIQVDIHIFNVLLRKKT